MTTKFDLDDFDRRLLELLKNDARTPVPDLADAIGLSAPACYRRIRRLRSIGAIEGEVAVVAPGALGWNLSMIVLLTLEREGNRTIRELMAQWAEHPQVVECAHVTGDYDFAIRLLARDMEDYADLVQRLFSDDDRVRQFKTLVVIGEARQHRSKKAA
ncbi:Lrp/AsnC family transcriptional regulator [Sphingomonas sp. GlSt437]|uniref:Lrp/AsnC family transcriptional regulator n=1 Tax=Sphingomonas sp. GlSt437 TaxID=3389970 RepID=UPI003A884BBF